MMVHCDNEHESKIVTQGVCCFVMGGKKRQAQVNDMKRFNVSHLGLHRSYLPGAEEQLG